MPTLNFVGGEKGGVGKSIVAMTLIAYFTDLGTEIVVCEADRSNGDVGRVVEGKNGHTVIYAFFSEDKTQTESADPVLDAVFEKNTACVISCPSQSSRAILKWFSAGSAEMAIEDGLNVNIWFVTNGQYDSMSLFLQSLVDHPSVQHILVRNTHFTDPLSHDFSDPETNPAVATALKEHNVPILNHQDIGNLAVTLRSKNLTFTEAQAAGPYAERSRIRKAVRDFSVQINNLVTQNAIRLTSASSEPSEPSEPVATNTTRTATGSTGSTKYRKSTTKSTGRKKRSPKSQSAGDNDPAQDSA